MKYLLLSIFVMLAAPPLQASFCDMCADKGNSHQAMPDSDMHHDSSLSMDCCDDPSTASDSGCSTMTHCGAGSASVAVFNVDMSSCWFKSNQGQVTALSQIPLNPFSSPPFRPPIS